MRVPLSVCAGLAAILSAAAPAGASEGDPAPRLQAGAQVTAVGQWHPALRSPYASPDLSFGPGASAGWSLTTTVLLGAVPWRGGVLVVMPEYANGRGMPNASGLAGYPDGDIVRVPKLGKEPYLARAYYQHVVALSGALTEPDPEADPEGAFMPAGPAGTGGPKPAARLEITVGKFAATDVFDLADATSDPRHRFMNWSLMNQGAWDYPADTRGYTWGAVVALEEERWSLRAAVALVPSTANGPAFDGDVLHHRGEVLEGEVRYDLAGSPGSAKLLLYLNHAHMGSYRDALARAAGGGVPDVDAVRRVGAVKYGAGLLLQQRLGPVQAFARAGLDDGATESFAFTEIDRSFSLGAELAGGSWGRPRDRVGLGAVVNGLSPEHADYLAAGGRGFQLGDGRLTYAWEAIGEAYYAIRVAAPLTVTFDVQGVVNPGMNADRGPALVAGLRLHAHL